MMNKVGIITLNGYFNYGNRLQNYALQEVLLNYGLKADTIVKNEETADKKIKKQIAIDKKIFLRILNKSIRMINRKKHNNINALKENKFKAFSETYLNELKCSPKENYDLFLNRISKKYKYFVTGSDQVWHPFNVKESSFYFLGFAPKNKRIAYAPSFAIDELPEEIKEHYKINLLNMKNISVREETGAKIIKKLIEKDVPVLIDPTLLLTKEKWMSLAKPAKNKPKSKFLVTYFLGGISTKEKKEINKFAKENKLKIINLGNIKEKETYMTGPSEFVDYIGSCDIMFTDSFHGAVFSILFEKPFVVYERVGNVSMYSRIETLLNMFKLENRAYKKLKLDSSIFNINYSHVPKILESERKKSFNYLKEALDIKEK